MDTHPINIITVDFEIRELSSGPITLDGDSPEANIVAVCKGQHTCAAFVGLQPRAPAEAEGGSVWDIVRIQGLLEV